MRYLKVLGVAAVLSLVGGQAMAVTVGGTRCTLGAVKTCAAYELTTTTGVGTTSVVLKVKNLQGSLAFDNTGGSELTKWILYGTGLGTASGLSITYDGTVFLTNPVGGWTLATPGPSELGGAPSVGAAVSTGNKGGIVGCTPVNDGDYRQTCPPTNAGWVVFNFSTNTLWNANSVAFGFKVQTPGGSYECRGDGATSTNGEGDCGDPRDPPNEVVPEPATMGLMAIGLFGLSGAGLIRRRRRSA